MKQKTTRDDHLRSTSKPPIAEHDERREHVDVKARRRELREKRRHSISMKESLR